MRFSRRFRLSPAGIARAEGSLQGHLVSLYVLTYDDVTRPLFLAQDAVQIAACGSMRKD